MKPFVLAILLGTLLVSTPASACFGDVLTEMKACSCGGGVGVLTTCHGSATRIVNTVRGGSARDPVLAGIYRGSSAEATLLQPRCWNR